MDRNQGYRQSMYQRQYMNRPSMKPSMPVQEPRCSACETKSLKPDMVGFSVAMAYVPWQMIGVTFPICEGFNKGTIFPELDLPFERGRCQCK